MNFFLLVCNYLFIFVIYKHKKMIADIEPAIILHCSCTALIHLMKAGLPEWETGFRIL
jgi:hypothetical protein